MPTRVTVIDCVDVSPSIVVTVTANVLEPWTSGIAFATKCALKSTSATTPLTVTDEFGGARTVPVTRTWSSATVDPSIPASTVTDGPEATLIVTAADVP